MTSQYQSPAAPFDETLLDETLLDETLFDETLFDETLLDETLLDETLVCELAEAMSLPLFRSGGSAMGLSATGAQG
jgi:hypothetical protein